MIARPDSPEVLLLRNFLSAAEDFVSGEQLAGVLGVSRVAVWKRIESLKKQGFEFEAIRRQGYRLTGFPEQATATGIFSRIDPAYEPKSIHLFDDNPSTNDAALRLLAEGADMPLACLTRKQPKGKGRRGRSWSGDIEGNLYASLAFRPEIRPRQLSLLPIWVGLRLCRRLREEFSISPRLKWPNDLLLDGKKFVGMLAEATFETDRVTALVFGIGMNVNMPHSSLSEELKDSATSLLIETGRKFDLDRVAASVIEEVTKAVRQCVSGLDEDRLADEWEEFACFQGDLVSIIGSDGKTVSGVLSGIDRAGSLLLRDSSGKLRSFRAGDVSLRRT